jgi:hypothetical protein
VKKTGELEGGERHRRFTLSLSNLTSFLKESIIISVSRRKEN